MIGDELWLLLKNVKIKKAYALLGETQKGILKLPTTRRKGGVYGGTKADSSIGRSFQTASAFVARAVMKVNNGES